MATITQSNYDNFLTWQKVNEVMTLAELQLNGMPGYVEGYSLAAQSVFNKMPNSLTTFEKDGIAAFVDTMVADGNWSKLDYFFGFFLSDVDNACTSWVGTKTATRVNSPTHNSKGFLLNGSNQYLNTLINMTTDLSNFTQNDNCTGVYIYDQLSTVANDYIYGIYEGGTATSGFKNALSTNYFGASGEGFDTHSDPPLTDKTRYVVRRSSSTTNTLRKNSMIIDTKTRASSGAFNNRVIPIGLVNINGTFDTSFACNVHLSYWYIGGAMDDSLTDGALSSLITYFGLDI